MNSLSPARKTSLRDINDYGEFVRERIRNVKSPNSLAAHSAHKAHNAEFQVSHGGKMRLINSPV
jgi:hypothetical protein